MFLIESMPNESDDELRTAIDRMLAGVFDSSEAKWWPAYDLGRAYKFGSRHFREFVCSAGSVVAHLMLAAERQRLPRDLIVVGKNAQGTTMGRILTHSTTESFDPTVLQAIKPL